MSERSIYNKVLPFVAMLVAVTWLWSCRPVSGGDAGDGGVDTIAFGSVYHGRYVSIGCPEGYVVVNNQLDDPLDVVMIGADSLDSLLSLPPLSLELKPQADNRLLRLPVVSVVLSRQRIVAPLRFFAELSAEAHMEWSDGNNRYLGVTDVDSLTIDGFGALEQHFGYLSPEGDTLNVRQIVVQLPDNTLFYVSSRYALSSDSAVAITESLLRSLKFNR